MFKQFATAALAISISTGALAGDQLTTSQFTSWTPEKQKGYIVTIAATAGVIAGFNRLNQAKCINAWGVANEPRGYPTVIAAMKKLPNYHPIAVITAVLQKECGPFKYTTTASAQP